MTARAHSLLPHGFTLMETVIAMVVLAVSSAAIISLNGNLRLQSGNFSKLQIGTQVLQACADEVQTNRKINGYGSTYNCPYTINPSNNISTGYTLLVSASPVSTSTAPSCPSNCQLVSISIAPQGGTAWAPVTLLFMQY